MAHTGLPMGGAVVAGDFRRTNGHRIEPELNTGCQLWAGSRSKAGYGTLTWEGETRLAHRCAYEDEHGVGAAAGVTVRHKCDTPPCVNTDHLIGGTQADNVQDAFDRGRINPRRGQHVNTAKLSPEEVLYIRRQGAAGRTVAAIAREFEMTHNAIDCVVKRRTWRHLKEEA